MDAGRGGEQIEAAARGRREAPDDRARLRREIGAMRIRLRPMIAAGRAAWGACAPWRSFPST